MGYTFAAALLKKTATAPGIRKAFREAMENQGYRKAASAEEASLSLRMYHDKKSAWLSLALEMPEDLDKELEFLRKVSAEMHTPFLYFMNFDSDFLYVAATDGKSVQHVHVGFIDEDDEAMTDSDDLSIFDALLPDDTARAEFRRILAVDDEERVFSEEAAQEMAVLFGYTPEVLFIDEDAKPFAEFNFELPGGEGVPFLMPEDAPVAFTMEYGVGNWGNPISMDIHSCGGAGKGIRVIMRTDGYDAEDWEAVCIWLSNKRNANFGYPAPSVYDEKVAPRRVTFADGSKGWVAEFPNAPISRGVNPASNASYSRKYPHYLSTRYGLTVAFTGGTFPQNAEKHYFARNEKTTIYVIPLQNPTGYISHTIPRSPLERVQWWFGGFVSDQKNKPE